MSRFVLATAAILLFLPGANAQETFALQILHMNDHHSHLQQESFAVATATLPFENNINTTAVEEIEVSYGGFARLVTLFEQLSSDESNTLKVHAGDIFAGTLFFTLYEGAADAAVMAGICFDVMTLGNHEFDLGNAVLEDFLVLLEEETSQVCGDSTTRVLSANVQAPPGSMLDAQVLPYSIQEYGEEQVAVIGLTTSIAALTSSPDADTVFGDEVEALEAAIAAIQEEAAVNKIVVVTHVGYEMDLATIAGVEGVDVVIGGHSHTLLGNPSDMEILGGNSGGGAFPTMMGDTCVVTAWEYAHGLGELNVVWDADGTVLSCDGSIKIPIDDATFEASDGSTLDDAFTLAFADYLGTFDILVPTEPDEETQALVAQYEEEIAAFGEEVIANVPQDICYERIPGQGRSSICTPDMTAMQGGGACNLVAKAFLEQAPSADVAIQNGGGCRVDIAAGDFTVNNAFTLLPFANTLVSLEMTGSEIVQVLNEATILALSGNSGSYPYASGLRFDVDGTNMDKPVSSVEVNVRLEGDFTPIEDDEVYTVVTNSFIAAGRDGYETFGVMEEVTDLYLEYATTFISYSQEVGTLVDPPLSEYSTQSFIPVVVADATDAPTAGMMEGGEDEDMMDESSPTSAPEETGDEPGDSSAFSSALFVSVALACLGVLILQM